MIVRVGLRRAVVALSIASALGPGCTRAGATSGSAVTHGDELAQMDVPGELDATAERETDATAARELDRWAARAATHARRGWTIPADIPREELERLWIQVALDLDEQRRPVGYRVVRPSGDTRYDAALEAHLGRMIAAGEPFPEPPAPHRPPRVLQLRFRGRGGS